MTHITLSPAETEALDAVVKAWGFRSAEGAIGFMIGVLTLTRPGTLLKDTGEEYKALWPRETTA